jgi:hypothetical protein
MWQKGFCHGKIKVKQTILATMRDRKLPKAKEMDCCTRHKKN